MNKTVAERLREIANGKSQYPGCELLVSVATGSARCRQDANTCTECKSKNLKDLADMIEAEQAELRAENERLCRDFYEPCARMGFTEHAHGIEVVFDAMSRAAQGHECRVDFKALDLLCDKLECGDANHRATAAQIRKAMKGVKPQLPEGIEWPRFEDGELVRFGDEFIAGEKEKAYEVVSVEFHSNGEFSLVAPNGAPGCFYSPRFCNGAPVKRPEPEVLDADGVPIKVGDTVWYGHEGECMVLCITRYDGAVFLDLSVIGANWNVGGVKPSEITHRKPDTQEAIDADCLLDASDYCEKHGIKVEHKYERGKAMCKHLLERQRKLLGGE